MTAKQATLSGAKERPILFSGPMVRAILDGRKTQTRRIVKLRVGGPNPPFPPGVLDFYNGEKWVGACDQDGRRGNALALCPYGVPGDRLWVKESIALDFKDGEYAQSSYVADGDLTKADAWPWKLKTLPAMFCPRGLSRLTLEVKAVRVERLQEISERDRKAEGSDCVRANVKRELAYAEIPKNVADATRPLAFKVLWDSINAKRGHAWETNPWVWVVEFEKVTP